MKSLDGIFTAALGPALIAVVLGSGNTAPAAMSGFSKFLSAWIGGVLVTAKASTPQDR